MARTKQAAPVRREPSSEYVSKLDRESALLAKQQELNGQAATAVGASNGSAKAKAAASGTSAKSAAGVRQVAIAVAGIYGSL